MFNEYTTPLKSLALTEARLAKATASTKMLQGYGSTPEALAVSQRYIAGAMEAVEARLVTPGSLKHIPTTFKTIAPEILALVGLQGLLDAVGDDMTRAEAIRHLGILCEVEARAASLKAQDAKRLKKAIAAIKKAHPTFSKRSKAVRSMPEFTKLPEGGWNAWTQRERNHAGHWVMEAVVPLGLFVLVDDKFAPSQEATGIMKAMSDTLIKRYPVRLPSPQADVWTAAQQDIGGFPTKDAPNNN